jgi:hypothetical protein
MIPLLEELLAALGAKVDREAVVRGYAAVSVDVAEARVWMHARGLAWVDDAEGRFPGEEDLAASVRAIVDSYRGSASVVGLVGAFTGWPGVAPEFAATLVQSLRLAQRMALVYGFDPHSERGGIVVTRALAAAWQVELPEGGVGEVRVAELPARVRSQLARVPPSAVAGWMVRIAGRSVAARFMRFVPGLSTVVGVREARRRMTEMGERMEPVVRAAMDRGRFELPGERRAVEVGQK